MAASLFGNQRVRERAGRIRHRAGEILAAHHAGRAVAPLQGARKNPAQAPDADRGTLRNREKWPDYERAVNDMVERTSTRLAPWTLVEANDKYFARLKVLRTACDAMERAL